jgi:hypothetical protein
MNHFVKPGESPADPNSNPKRLKRAITPRRKRLRTPCRSIFRPALLRSESAREFATHRKKIFQHFCPTNYLEELLLDRYVKSIWEVLRLQQFGPQIINNAYIPGLEGTLAMTSDMAGLDTNHLARGFYTDSDCKRLCQERLAQTGCNEVSVEAEAFRLRAPSLQAHEKLLSATEKRSYRLLRYS